ncbi:hypothetical protein B0H34DRAFT_398084 [Crassisporium funariophilum]|nr:hypothetical protein B0H34DRAFT_398084 [Crassisporium funariophilum]
MTLNVSRNLIIKHNLLSGYALVIWSFYPESVFNAGAFILYRVPQTILYMWPKAILYTLRSMSGGFLRGFRDRGIDRGRAFLARCFGQQTPDYSQVAQPPSYAATRSRHHSRIVQHGLEEPGVWRDLFSWVLFIGGVSMLGLYEFGKLGK